MELKRVLAENALPVSAAQEELRLHPSFTAICVQLLPFFFLLSLALSIIFLIHTNTGAHLMSDNTIRMCRQGVRMVFFIFAIEALRRYFNDLYRFNSARIIHHHGRLSLNYHVSSLKYDDIRETLVEQSIIGRLLGYGHVNIATASTSDFEIELRYVSNPKALSRWMPTHKIEKRAH